MSDTTTWGSVPTDNLDALPALLWKQVNERGDEPALIDGVSGETFTARQLWARASRVRAHLESQGVAPGDRVAMIGTATLASTLGVWGTMLAGATLVPLNYRLPAQDLRWMIADGEAKALIADERYLRLLAEGADSESADSEHSPELPTVCLDGSWPGATSLESLLAGTPDDDELRPPHDVGIDDAIYVIYTSGTTAQPKGVVQAHRGYAATAAEQLPVPPQWVRFLHALPLYHLAGIGVLTINLARGSQIVLLDHFAPESFLGAIQAHEPNMTFLVPTMMCDLVEYEHIDRFDVSPLKSIAYGSAPTPTPILLAMIERFPCFYMQLYSQTEGTSRVTMLSGEDHMLSEDPEIRAKQIRRLSSIGRVIEGAEVRVSDADGAEVPRGEVGNLWYRTPGMMKGYLGREADTRDTLRDGWVVSGDMARMDEDDYIFLVGRDKDFLIRGGENIAPRAIEEALEAHPQVAEAAVVGQPDARWGEVPVAFVRCPGNMPDEPSLIEHCRARLPKFKVPVRVWTRRELPRNSIGKILKRVLVEELRAMQSEETT